MPSVEAPARKCPWCYGKGYYERVRVCPCRAPERATDDERRRRYQFVTHDPACDEGWVYVRVTCDCGAAR